MMKQADIELLRLRIFKSFLAICICLIMLPGILFCQDDISSTSKEFDPVISIKEPVKFSEGQFRNQMKYSGDAYGIKGESRIHIREFEPNTNFSLQIEDYDSLNFYYSLPGEDEIYFSIKTVDNKKFKYKIVPGNGVVLMDNIYLNTQVLGKITGKIVYDVTISDDISPFRIKVEPMTESRPYIEVLESADSNKYVIRLKSNEIIKSLTSLDKEKFKRQGYMEIPVGIVMTDPEIKDHTSPHKLFLRQKLKKAKKN